MNIGIVGQGAISTLFAYYWRNSSPIILVRELPSTTQSISLLDDQTITLEHNFDKVTAPINTKFDYILVAIKSYQIDSLITSLLPWLPTQTSLVLVQNGMGGAEALANAFPNNRLFVGTTTDAVFKKADGHFQVTAQGRLDIGLWLPTEQNYAAQMDTKSYQLLNTHPKLVMYSDIKIALYQKLAVNAVINPTTALLNIKNGQLVHHHELVEKLKLEISDLYSAYFPPDLTNGNEALSAQYLSQLIDKVIQDTANNYSSMQQDVFLGRQTEVDAVLGYLLRKADCLGVEMPNIEGLYGRLVRGEDNTKR